MYEYIEPYPTYDKILGLFIDNPHHRLDEGGIYSKFDQDKQHGVRSAMASLEELKCIKKDSPTGNWFILLAEGSSIYNSGGFRSNLERQRIAHEIKSQLEAASLNMADSVIKTNDSVEATNISIQRLNTITEENIPRQNRIAKTALWVAAASALIALGSVLKDLWKPDRLLLITPTTQDSISQSKERKIDTLKPTPQTKNHSLKDSTSDSSHLK